MNHEELIATVVAADQAINRRDMAAVMDFYDDDAVLVVQPGRIARGKGEIAQAFDAIFKFFNHSLVVTQSDFQVVQGGDVALVMCNLKLSAAGETSASVSMERKPTYVFRKSVDGKWRCLVDNSYGVELVEK